MLEQNLSVILKALRSTRPYTWPVTEIRVKLIGDLNVQIKGPGKLRLFFLPKLFWLLRNEFAEKTNLIHFLLGAQQRYFGGVNITK